MLFFSLHFMVIIMYSLIVTYSSSVTSNGLYLSLSLSLWWWIFIWDQVHVQVENLHKPASIYKRTVAYFIWWWILIFQTKSTAINKNFYLFKFYIHLGSTKYSTYSFKSGERKLSKNSINKDLSVFPSLCILCISQYCSRYKMFRIKLGRGIKVLQA